jgi:hypothetical protein
MFEFLNEIKKPSGAEKRNKQPSRSNKEEAEAVGARAGRATTDAAGVLESGISEAKASVEKRKSEPKKIHTPGPIEQRARDISMRTLGGVYGKRVWGNIRPEDAHPDLRGKGMSGDEAAGVDILLGMRHEIGSMMTRRFEPARGGDPLFEEAPELDDKARRHINLAREKTQVAPLERGPRVRKFSQVQRSGVDPKEIPTQTQRPSISPEVSQRMQQARQLGAQDFSRQRTADQLRSTQMAALSANVSLRDTKATSPIQPSGWTAQRRISAASADFGPYAQRPKAPANLGPVYGPGRAERRMAMTNRSTEYGPGRDELNKIRANDMKGMKERSESPGYDTDYGPGRAELNAIRYQQVQERFGEVDKKASGS